MAFDAQHVSHAGSFVLPLPPERAFSLFSPEGERGWVRDWTPEYLYPRNGTPSSGLVFRTHVDGEQTLWLVVRYDTEAFEAEYVRVVPDSRLGTVIVRCRPAEEDRTRVDVMYSLTAVSDSGNVTLASFTEEVFAAMLTEWQRGITAVLASSTNAPHPSVSNR